MPVTDADVAHVRDAYLEFNERRATFSADDLTAYFRRFYDDEAVIENVEGFPLATSYEGLDGYHRWYEESYSPYEDVAGRSSATRSASASSRDVGARAPRGEPTSSRSSSGSPTRCAAASVTCGSTSATSGRSRRHV